MTTMRVPLGTRVSKPAELDAVLLAGVETSAGAAAAGAVFVEDGAALAGAETSAGTAAAGLVVDALPSDAGAVFVEDGAALAGAETSAGAAAAGLVVDALPSDAGAGAAFVEDGAALAGAETPAGAVLGDVPSSARAGVAQRALKTSVNSTMTAGTVRRRILLMILSFPFCN